MAQAECIIKAIRELMSRGCPNSTSPAQAAHIEFVAAFAGNVPHPIYAEVDSEDLDGRAEHLEGVSATVHVYLTAIINDTVQTGPGGLDLLSGVASDLTIIIQHVADEMAERIS
jgi:hypothetical protein